MLAGVKPFLLGELKAKSLCTAPYSLPPVATADVATDVSAAMKSFFQMPNLYIVLKSHLMSEQ